MSDVVKEPKKVIIDGTGIEFEERNREQWGRYTLASSQEDVFKVFDPANPKFLDFLDKQEAIMLQLSSDPVKNIDTLVKLREFYPTPTVEIYTDITLDKMVTNSGHYILSMKDTGNDNAYLDSLQGLIAAGATVSRTQRQVEQGSVPLLVTAAQNLPLEVVEQVMGILKAAGADPTETDKNGLTADDIYKQRVEEDLKLKEKIAQERMEDMRSKGIAPSKFLGDVKGAVDERLAVLNAESGLEWKYDEKRHTITAHAPDADSLKHTVKAITDSRFAASHAVHDARHAVSITEDALLESPLERVHNFAAQVKAGVKKPAVAMAL